MAIYLSSLVWFCDCSSNVNTHSLKVEQSIKYHCFTHILTHQTVARQSLKTKLNSIHYIFGHPSTVRPNKRTTILLITFRFGIYRNELTRECVCGVQTVPINPIHGIDLSGFNLSKCKKSAPPDWMRWFIWNVSDDYRKAINPQMALHFG